MLEWGEFEVFFCAFPTVESAYMFLFRRFSLGSRTQALEGEQLFTKKPLLCYENIASADIILFLTTTSLLGICSEL